MARSPQSGQAAQQTQGLPQGFRAYSPFPFAGMNQKDSSHAIADQEFRYIENWVLLGKGQLRTLWDAGKALYTAPSGLGIISFFFYNIQQTYYAAVFLSDGSAVQVQVSSAAVTQIGPAGTFYHTPSSNIPACGQWGTLFLLISNNNTSNDYWIWDGVTLYQAGSAAPQGVVLDSTGQNYTGLPTVTAFGGSGSGMTFTPVENSGGVVQVAIDNPGSHYQAGDVVQLAFSGGGSDTSAELVANLTNGGVAAVNVTNAGSGYAAATVAFSGGGGSGAAATAVIGQGVNSITITSPGANYTEANVSFTGGTGAGGTVATANIVGGQVVSITIITEGQYTAAPTVTITGDGTGATGTANLDTGQIIGITVTSPGTGYTSAPTVTISSGSGTGATAQAFLQGGSVAGVTVVNGGSGFIYAPNVTFEGGGGSGAVGTVTLTPTSIARVSMTSGGANYQKVPTVTFVGGGPNASGAKATAVLGGGQVIAINVTNGGSNYTQNVEVIITAQKGDTGTGAGAVATFAATSISGVIMSSYGVNYTNAPAVVVAPGANHAAYATVTMMPFGVSGGGIETFQQCVWLINQAPPSYSIQTPGQGWIKSAPASYTDFATSDGGVLFTNTDAFLQTRYTGVKQANGYLYFFGDGSVSVVSNVNTSGSPATTTFTYQNADPQSGLSWRDSLLAFGRTLLYGNETGVYGLYGGAATKVSEKLDQIFTTALFPPAIGAITPTAAIATIFNVKHYMMLMTILDVDTAQPRNVMVTWNERDWVVTSQGINLLYIGEQKVESKFIAWGTDGKGLYPLFNKPSSTLEKKLYTKMYGGDQPLELRDLHEVWINAQDQTAGSGISGTFTFNLSGIAVQAEPFYSVPSVTTASVLFAQPSFGAASPYWPVWGTASGGAPFSAIGADFTTTSPDFILGNLVIGHVPVQAYA